MFPKIVRSVVNSGASGRLLTASVTRHPPTWMYYSSSVSTRKLIPKREEFASRHIGPRASDRDQMLAYIGYKVSNDGIFLSDLVFGLFPNDFICPDFN